MALCAFGSIDLFTLNTPSVGNVYTRSIRCWFVLAITNLQSVKTRFSAGCLFRCHSVRLTVSHLCVILRPNRSFTLDHSDQCFAHSLTHTITVGHRSLMANHLLGFLLLCNSFSSPVWHVILSVWLVYRFLYSFSKCCMRLNSFCLSHDPNFSSLPVISGNVGAKLLRIKQANLAFRSLRIVLLKPWKRDTFVGVLRCKRLCQTPSKQHCLLLIHFRDIDSCPGKRNTNKRTTGLV